MHKSNKKTEALNLSGLWTWDHSTNWSNDINKVESGCFNKYTKRAESFLEDYRLLMEMMRQKGIHYLIIWGLFRDSHGGEKAVRRLLEIARANKVKILAGVGVNAYGGVYWEGNHPWNLATWLKKHPHLAAVRKNARPFPHFNACGSEIACPSKEENINWIQKGIQWLLENFDVAGVNLETGDYGICECKECSKHSKGRSETFSFEDMAIVLPSVIEAARKASKDALLTYATYTGFTKEMMETPPEIFKKIPEDAVCQWTLTHMLEGKGWPGGLYPPAKRNIGFSHRGTQWHYPNTRHSLIVNHIKEICGRASKSGLEGIIISGEVSGQADFIWEMNYAAFSYFIRRPDSTLEEFAENSLTDEFGGEKEAVKAVKYMTEVVSRRELSGRLEDCGFYIMKTRGGTRRNWNLLRDILYSRML